MGIFTRPTPLARLDAPSVSIPAAISAKAFCMEYSPPCIRESCAAIRWCAVNEPQALKMEGGPMSRIHLGINTCFAVKRWPEPEQWVQIVKDELGLDCCQFSFDLIDPLFDEEAVQAYVDETRRVASARGLQIHSTFTGLAAYSWSLLLHPDARSRLAALRWYKRAIDVSARLGAWGTGGHIGAFSARDFANTARKSARLTELQEHLSTIAHYASQRGLRFLLF